MILKKGKKPTKKQRLIFWGVALSIFSVLFYGVNWYSNNSRFIIAAKNGETEVVKDFLSKGYNANVRVPMRMYGSFTNLTPLDAAMTTNNPEIVSALLSAGADPNAPNNEGLTPLFAAIIDAERNETVRYLLAHGADPNQKNFAGYTVLQIAASQGASADILALLDAGALVDDVGGVSGTASEQFTPLMYFATFTKQSDDLEIPQLLLNAGANLEHQTKEGKSALTIVEERFPDSALYHFLTTWGK